MKSISVVIPNYNGKDLLKEYLPAVYNALNCNSISAYEIIVVDDASTDDSVAFLQSNCPDVIVIYSDSNCGFSQTANKGIFGAKYDYVFLLNNDMSLAPDIFEKLLAVFEIEEDIFGVFPKTMDKTGTKVIEGQKLPRKKKGQIHYDDNLEQKEISYTFYLCGGNSLVNREKLIALGGFDTIYSPFYFEDFDLSLRAWKKGWKCYYSPETYCLHCHSVSINSNFTKEFVETIFVRNRFIFNYIHIDREMGLLRFKLKIGFKYILSLLFPSSNSKKRFKQAFQKYIELNDSVKKTRIKNQKNANYSLAQIVNKYF